MAADDLAMQGAMASAAIDLVYPEYSCLVTRVKIQYFLIMKIYLKMSYTDRNTLFNTNTNMS